MSKIPDCSNRFLSPNYHYYDELERCWRNQLFDDKNLKPYEEDYGPDGAGGVKSIPRHERRPCIIPDLGGQIVESVVSYTFGSDSFPTIYAVADSDIFGTPVPVNPEDLAEDETEEENPEPADTLPPIQAANVKIQNLLNGIVEKGYFKSKMLSVGRYAVAQGCTIAVAKIINGRPSTETINMKWVHDLILDPNDNQTIISFCEVKRCLDLDAEGNMCWYWNKRSWDQEYEYIYEPIKDADLPSEANLSIFRIKYQTPHKLKRCPAILICANEDRTSVFSNQLSNIKEYAYYTSDVHMGLVKNMNPQPVWMGENPPTALNLIRSSQVVWMFPTGTFTTLAPNPQAYQYAMDQEQRVRELILRGCRTIEIPNKNYQSGDAIKLKLAPETNLINEVRVEIGQKGMVDLLYLHLELVVAYGNAVDPMTDPETQQQMVDDNGEPLVMVYDLDVGKGNEIPKVADCDITLAWGPIFVSTPNDKNLNAQTAQMLTATDGEDEPIFSKYTVRQAMKSDYNINDLGDEAIQIEKEKITSYRDLAARGIIEAASKAGNFQLLAKILMELNSDSVNLVDAFSEYVTGFPGEPAAEEVGEAVEESEEELGEAPETETEDESPTPPKKKEKTKA